MTEVKLTWRATLRYKTSHGVISAEVNKACPQMAYPMGNFEHSTFLLNSYQRPLIDNLEETSQIH